MEIMKYFLLYHPDVKEIDLPPIPANIKQRIKNAIENRLLTDPVRFGVPLRRSLKGYRKLRVGDYRIIYRLKGSLTMILKIGHRKEVYYQSEKRITCQN